MESQQAGTHLLVVIDHRGGGFSAAIARLAAAADYAVRSVRFWPGVALQAGRLQRPCKPEQKSFYEAVARTLSAEKILIFGAGTGAIFAMEQLLRDLKRHHHEFAERIVGTIKVDEHHLTEAQLLAKPLEYFDSNESAAGFPR